MSSPGARPDCVHCRFMVRLKNGEYRCRQHDITLHSPVSIFCKHIRPPEENAEFQEWVREVLEDEELDNNTLYTWVETFLYDKTSGTQVAVDAEAVAPLTSYVTWSAGVFWQVLRQVRRSRKEDYRKRGYDTGTTQD